MSILSDDTARKGGWFETFSGIMFWPLDPRPEDVCIEDIAHSLANTCRYSGHCKFFYSVAQHCILCVEYAAKLGYDARLQLYTLLHDAAEAYVCDVPSPLKPYLFGYKEAENGVEAAILKHFGLPAMTPDIAGAVKFVDVRVLHIEAPVLLKHAYWAEPVINPGIVVDPWTIERACEQYSNTLQMLLTENNLTG